MEKLTQTMLKIPELLKGLLKPKKSEEPKPAKVAPVVPQGSVLQVAPAPAVQAVPALPSKIPAIKIPKKIIIVVGALFVILIVLMVVMKLAGGRGSSVFPISSPSASPEATPETEVPSQYADDEDVRKIQEDLQALDKELNEAEFRDDRLRIPTLDWEVEFKD